MSTPGVGVASGGGGGSGVFAQRLMNTMNSLRDKVGEQYARVNEDNPPEPPQQKAGTPTLAPPKDDSTLAGNLATLGNSFIAFVGAGILDLPYAYSKVGLTMGTAVTAVVACICLYCMFLLVDCKILLEKSGKRIQTYGDVGKEAYGAAGGAFVDISLMITQFGFCTAYLILISHNMDSILADSPGFIPYIWLCVPGQLMLSTLRHLKFLGKFSIVADVTMAFALGTVFYYCKTEMDAHAEEGVEVQRLHSDTSMVPYFFGVCIYCYEGIGMVIPIQNAMRNKHQFKLVWGLNMVLVTLLFWGVGFVGYYAYGVSVRESISSNLPAFEKLQVMVQIALSVGLYFTFPVMMFPVYQILDSYRGAKDAEADFKSNIVRFVVVFASAFVASAVPSFSSFIVLVGSSTCALLALILPAVFSLKLQSSSPVGMCSRAHVHTRPHASPPQRLSGKER